MKGLNTPAHDDEAHGLNTSKLKLAALKQLDAADGKSDGQIEDSKLLKAEGLQEAIEDVDGKLEKGKKHPVGTVMNWMRRQKTVAKLIMGLSFGAMATGVVSPNEAKADEGEVVLVENSLGKGVEVEPTPENLEKYLDKAVAEKGVLSIYLKTEGGSKSKFVIDSKNNRIDSISLLPDETEGIGRIELVTESKDIKTAAYENLLSLLSQNGTEGYKMQYYTNS